MNKDLKFTAETAEDFEDQRLPTLDFSLWLENNGEINHSYFQKPMKTCYVTMKESAMSQHQKVQILSNEIVRRLSNVNYPKIGKGEIRRIIEVAIKDMKTYGYDRINTREIVCSGITGWMRKMKRRSTEEGGMYRPAKSTLAGRCKKKLLAKTNWYKKRKNREEDEMEEEEDFREKKKKKTDKERQEIKKGEDKAKAVLFIPFTNNSLLAKNLREAEEKLFSLTGYRLKVVERAGLKLEDLLRQSDPWQGTDCLRESCLLCHTKEKTERIRSRVA